MSRSDDDAIVHMDDYPSRSEPCSGRSLSSLRELVRVEVFVRGNVLLLRLQFKRGLGEGFPDERQGLGTTEVVVGSIGSASL